MKKVIILFILVFLISGCSAGSTAGKYKKLEKKFVNIAEKYYEEVGKIKVVGIDQHTIFISNLNSAGYDTSELIDPETGAACDENSSVTIIIGDNGYSTKVNLICGSYRSE
ncbi:MAG TPA: hypothetical protein PLT65_05715 [Bacilli bacterium]|nr:hypothetical protein [Bacilli bacterium]